MGWPRANCEAVAENPGAGDRATFQPDALKLVNKTMLDQWYAKVVAARKAVEEAEKALVAAATPVEQTLAFRELKAREWTLQQTLMSQI